MSQLLFLAVIAMSYSANAVEYLCWQASDFPPMAYEASTSLCPTGKKEKGTISDTPETKKIVCLVPANCIALTPALIKVLERRTSKSMSEIQKMGGIQIDTALAGTGYVGRASQVACEGSGTMGLSYGAINLVDATCPNATTCANSEEIFYGMAMKIPNVTQPFRASQGTSPTQFMPRSQK